jgi:HEAT repeat protein
MGFFVDTVARLAITEVFKAILAEVKSRLNPDEMISILEKAEVAADATQPELFRRIDRNGANGYQKFLKFFQSGEVLRELEKPLKDRGKPDVNILLEAFNRSISEHPDAENYRSDLMPLWMEAFVESYFEQVKGICFQVAKAQYLKQLARRVDDVKFVGIAVPGEEVEKQEVLAQIFVMPDVRVTKNRTTLDDIDYGCIVDSAPADLPEQEYQELLNYVQRKNLLQEQKAWATRDRSAPRIPAQKVINLAQKKAVVLGAPGSGKTMLASYFALMLCETAQSDPSQIGLKAEDDYLPVVVRIRDWILESKMGLLEYLRSNAESNLACKELPPGFFEHWLERGQALILLDGLDEVVDEAQRRKVAEQIETFLHQYQDNPAVITSRPAGYRWDFFNLDEFPHYTLESFDDKQVATFIDHWYDSRLKENPAQADRRKADLQKAFARNERIRLLAKNPLLLTIITLIHRYQAELPRQRCKLYEKAVETLLTSWDSGKEIKLYSQVLLFLKSDDLLYILKKLAYWIHTQGSTGETEGGTLIDRDELIRWLRKEIQTLKKCEAHEAKGEAERFIDFIQRRTGLLNEQGRDRYAFVHKTFQEYLTAEEIFDRADVEDDTEIILDHFRRHLHDQHWREVLLLLVSKLKGKKAQKAIQAVLDAGSEYEQWLHRDLLFAGWCLTEDPPELTVVAQDWVGEILDRLVGLEVEKLDLIGNKISIEVTNILHCFGETKIEPHIWEKLKVNENRLSNFRLLKFQATLGQKTEAINILIPFLSDEKWYMRYRAAVGLFELGNTSKQVASCLVSLLVEEHSTVRYHTILGLNRLGDVSTIVNGLLSFLGDENSNTRYHAASALGGLGNTSTAVVNALLPLLADENSTVRSRVATTLGKLGNASTEVVSSLVSLLSDKNSKVRYYAASALGKLGNASAAVVTGLLSLLNDENSTVRSSASVSLVQLGKVNTEVMNSLLSLLNDEKSGIRSRVITVLGKLGHTNPVVMTVLLSLLDDKKSNVRSHAALSLVQLGNMNTDVMTVLLSLLDDKKSNVRSRVAKALGELDRTNPAVVNGLLSLLRDENENVRDYSASALVRLSKISDTICPELVQWLEQNPNHDGIGNAIDCLWSIVVE